MRELSLATFRTLPPWSPTSRPIPWTRPRLLSSPQAAGAIMETEADYSEEPHIAQADSSEETELINCKLMEAYLMSGSDEEMPSGRSPPWSPGFVSGYRAG